MGQYFLLFKCLLNNFSFELWKIKQYFLNCAYICPIYLAIGNSNGCSISSNSRQRVCFSKGITILVDLEGISIFSKEFDSSLMDHIDVFCNFLIYKDSLVLFKSKFLQLFNQSPCSFIILKIFQEPYVLDHRSKLEVNHLFFECGWQLIDHCVGLMFLC